MSGMGQLGRRVGDTEGRRGVTLRGEMGHGGQCRSTAGGTGWGWAASLAPMDLETQAQGGHQGTGNPARVSEVRAHQAEGGAQPGALRSPAAGTRARVSQSHTLP